MQNLPDQLFNLIEMMGHFFRPCFGPCGLDKLIQDRFNNDLIVSNDGGTILKNLKEMLNPFLGKVVISWAKPLTVETGDGIKGFFILLGDLAHQIREVKLMGISTIDILTGLQVIKNEWQSLLNNPRFCFSNLNNDGSLPDTFYHDYLQSLIAGKISPVNGDHLIEISLLVLKKILPFIFNPQFRWESSILFESIPGTSVQDTQFLDGILISKDPIIGAQLEASGIKFPKVLLISQKLYFELPKKKEKDESGISLQIDISNPQAQLELESWHRQQIQTWFNKIYFFQPDIIITEKGTDPLFEHLCSTNGIILIRRAKSEEFRALGRYLQISPVENLESLNELNFAQVGELIQYKIRNDIHIIIKYKDQQSNYEPNSISIPTIGTILIGGSIWQICQEIERYIKKIIITMIEVTKDPHFFYGGGNLELIFYEILKRKSNLIPNKAAVAIESFANSFLLIPQLLIENSGKEPIEEIQELLQNYRNGRYEIGFNSNRGEIISMKNACIYDIFQVKKKQYQLLFEILPQLARIDTILNKVKK